MPSQHSTLCIKVGFVIDARRLPYTEGDPWVQARCVVHKLENAVQRQVEEAYPDAKVRVHGGAWEEDGEIQVTVQPEDADLESRVWCLATKTLDETWESL